MEVRLRPIVINDEPEYNFVAIPSKKKRKKPLPSAGHPVGPTRSRDDSKKTTLPTSSPTPYTSSGTVDDYPGECCTYTQIPETHACKAAATVSWDEVKQLIMGRLSPSGSFICGTCDHTFPTLCSLHLHCIGHNGTGSFFFDSKTKTGYPKFDSKCCYTQVDEMFFDLNNHDRNSFESVKYGQAKDICDNTCTLETFCDEPEASLDCDNVQVDNEASLSNSEQGGSSCETAFVEVRNLRTENGCILFDMDDSISHLYDATVGVILKNIETVGEEWLKNAARSITLEVASSSAVKMTSEAPCPVDDPVSPVCCSKPDHGCKSQNDASERKSPQDTVSKAHMVLDTNQDNTSGFGNTIRTSNSGRPIRNRRPTQKFINNKFLGDLVSITCRNGPMKSESVCKMDTDRETEGIDSENKNQLENGGKVVETVSLDDKYTNVDDEEVNVNEDLHDDSHKCENSISSEVNTEVNQLEVNMGDMEMNESDHELRDTKDDIKKYEKNEPVKTKCQETDTKSLKKRRIMAKKMPKLDRHKVNSLLKKESLSEEVRGSKQYNCETCGKFGSLAMLRYHREVHSGKLNYVCDMCGKAYSTRACLRAHKIHHADKQFKCHYCPAAFYRKHYLENHLFKHTGADPYRHTCEMCGERFKESYILRRHVATFHQQLRNFECDICHEKFFRTSTLQHHKKRHFEPTLPCRFCDKCFKVDLDRRKHELTHTDDKQYSCPRCGQSFRQIWPYYRHMWRIHNIPKELAKEMKIKNPDIVNMRNIKLSYGHLKETSKEVPEAQNLQIVQKVVRKNVRRGQIPVGYTDFRGLDNHGMMYRIDHLEAMDHGEVAYAETDSHIVMINETNEMQTNVAGINIVIESGNEVDSNAAVEYVVSEGGLGDEQLGDTIILNMDDGIGQEETIVIKASDLNDTREYVLLDSGQLVQTGQDSGLVIYSDYQTHGVVSADS